MADEIEVTFIDAATNTPFERVRVPAGQLPEAFDRPTTLHLGDLDWTVESADPATRAEYEQTKKLELHLRKVEKVDPRKILYSLPTIENALPPSKGGAITGEELVIHEDEWRQLELISSIHEDALDEELDAIGEILLNHRAGAGFKKIHIRARIPNPIAPNALELSALGTPTTKPLALRDTPERITNGFAVELAPNASLFGITEADRVSVLCLRIQGAVEDETLNTIVRLEKDHDLIFVDWCSARTGTRAFFQ